jgi:hypothetical protein
VTIKDWRGVHSRLRNATIAPELDWTSRSCSIIMPMSRVSRDSCQAAGVRGGRYHCQALLNSCRMCPLPRFLPAQTSRGRTSKSRRRRVTTRLELDGEVELTPRKLQVKSSPRLDPSGRSKHHIILPSTATDCSASQVQGGSLCSKSRRFSRGDTLPAPGPYGIAGPHCNRLQCSAG